MIILKLRLSHDISPFKKFPGNSFPVITSKDSTLILHLPLPNVTAATRVLRSGLTVEELLEAVKKNKAKQNKAKGLS